MTRSDETNGGLPQLHDDTTSQAEKVDNTRPPRWKKLFSLSKAIKTLPASKRSSDGFEDVKARPEKWSLGVLNDKETEEVPGTCA